MTSRIVPPNVPPHVFAFSPVYLPGHESRHAQEAEHNHHTRLGRSGRSTISWGLRFYRAVAAIATSSQRSVVVQFGFPQG